MSGTLVALAERLQGLCLGRGLTVAVAESCTGGLVATSITEVPGSSGYFTGAVVSYADSAKIALLGVPQATLAAHGAVSAQVALAMATSARARFETTFAIAVTGVAGPDGGSEEKPVGLTYVAFAGPAGAEVRRLQFGSDRAGNREAAARDALEWLVDAAAAGT